MKPSTGKRLNAHSHLGPVSVEFPVDPADWEAVYQSSRLALPSQSSTWMKAIVGSESYRDASRCYTFKDGRKAILTAAIHKHRPPLLNGLYSPPVGWGFGGAIADGPVEASHVAAILADLASQPSLVKHVRPNPLEAAAWQSGAPEQWMRISRVAHVLSLEGGHDQVWKSRFRSNTRTRVRNAERSVTVKSGNDEGMMRELHAMLMHSVARWAKKQHEPLALARWRKRQMDPESKFMTILKEAGSLVRIYTAYVAGSPAASILVLRDKEAHYTRGAMVEELAGPSNANYALHAKAIEEACQAGCSHYHMGETGANSNLAQFKTRFGAEPVPYSEFRLERLPVTPVMNAAKRLLKAGMGFKDA
jgi:hypothetical protein